MSLDKIMGMISGGQGSTGGGGTKDASGRSKASQSGSGMTGNEMAGGLIGLLIGTAIGKTNAERNRQATEQSAIENLYSPFTGKRGANVPIYADYVDPLKGLIAGIAQGQKLGGPVKGSGGKSGETGSADSYQAAAALSDPTTQQGSADPAPAQGGYTGGPFYPPTNLYNNPYGY